MAIDIYINGVITPDEFKQEHIDQGYSVYSYNDLINDLGEEKEANVYIDSIGGMVEEGFKIYEKLLQINANTIALNASSIASVIFLAGKKRSVSPNAEMIIHNGWIEPTDLDNMVINVHSLNELKEEFEQMDSEIVNIYTKHTNLTDSKALALMSQDTDIAKQAIELGFADSIYQEKDEPILARSYNRKYLIFNKKTIEMANEATEKRLTGIEKILNGILNVFKGKNMLVTLEGGQEIFVYSEDGEFEGKKAVLAVDGNPTEELAPAGEHRLSDGRVILVGEGGVIEAVQEAVSTDDLEAKIAAMEEDKEKLEQARAEFEAKYNALVKDSEEKEAEMKTKFEDLANQIKALKKEIVGGDPDDKPKNVIKAMSQDEFMKLPYSERLKLQFKNSK